MIEHNNDTKTVLIVDTSDPEGLTTFLTNNNIGFKRVVGRYKGHDETPFVIDLDTLYAPSVPIEGLNKFVKDQESMLLVQGKREGLPERLCVLIFVDSRPSIYGHWRQVSKKAAEKGDSFTFDPLTGSYWVADFSDTTE